MDTDNAVEIAWVNVQGWVEEDKGGKLGQL